MSVLKYKAPNGKWLPVGTGGASKPLPYDVVTNSIGGGGGWAKLTIADDWTDGVQHPYRLIVSVYEDDMVYSAWESTFYSPRSDGYCYVEGSMSAICPKYVNGNDVYITMVNTSDYKVYVKRLDGICTGATLEWVDSLPDNALEVSQGTRSVDQSYISYTANGVTKLRPIAFNSQKYSIVCRNSAGDIITTSFNSEDAAVSKRYVRDTMLAPVVEDVEAIEERVDFLEGALLQYTTYNGIAYTHTMPENSAFQSNAIISQLGGQVQLIRSFVKLNPEILYPEYDEGRPNYGVPGYQFDESTGHVTIGWEFYIGQDNPTSLKLLTLPAGNWNVIVRNLTYYYYTPDDDVRYEGLAFDYTLSNTGVVESDGSLSVLFTTDGTDGILQYIEFDILVEAVKGDTTTTYPEPAIEYVQAAKVTAIVGKETYTIPDDVQGLSGYGLAVPKPVGNVDANYYNYIDFATKQFTQRCGIKTIAAEDLWIYSSGSNVVYVGIASPTGYRLYDAYVKGFVFSTGYFGDYSRNVRRTFAKYVQNPNTNTYQECFLLGLPAGTTLEQAQEMLVGRHFYFDVRRDTVTDISEYLTDYNDNLILPIGRTVTCKNDNEVPAPITLSYSKVPKGG